MDFETAALTAFGDVFPKAVLKGCLFHYSQAVQWNVARDGLETDCVQENPTIRCTRIRRCAQMDGSVVAGGTFTGAAGISQSCLEQYCLTNLPRTGDNQVDANLTAFREYYFRQWLRPGRPTHNQSRGRLPSRTFQCLRHQKKAPPLGIFLGKMQELHHDEIRQRVRQLQQQGAAPNPRRPANVRNVIRWLRIPRSTVAGQHATSYRRRTARSPLTSFASRSILPWLTLLLSLTNAFYSLSFYRLFL